MRIISTFKDYYYGIQAYGLDGDRVYLRKRKAHLIDASIVQSASPSVEEVNWYAETLGYGFVSDINKRVDAHYLLIGYCGKYFPLGAVSHYHETRVGRSRTWHYDGSEYYTEPADLTQAMVACVEHYPSRYQNPWTEETPVIQRIQTAFAKLQAACADFEDHRLFRHAASPLLCRGFTNEPVDVVPSWLRYRTRKTHAGLTSLVLANPRLKTFGFARIKDPYTCFQDISQYLSGVLGSTEVDGTDLTDKQQVQRHGFDPVYGFRKRPRE